MICQRDAPTAARIGELTGTRGAARGSRLARFAHAMSRTSADRAEQQVETGAVIAHLVFEQRSHGHAHRGV